MLHVAKEWGVRPSDVMEWSVEEYGLARAYLSRIAELSKPEES